MWRVQPGNRRPGFRSLEACGGRLAAAPSTFHDEEGSQAAGAFFLCSGRRLRRRYGIAGAIPSTQRSLKPGACGARVSF
jgi:hypothetical protein